VSPGDVTGNRVVKHCGEANTEWNYNTKERDNFQYKSKQLNPSHLGIRNDGRIMEPKKGGCLTLVT
jgi:hypothetical protein